MLPRPDTETVEQEEMRAFLLVLRQALFQIIFFIEKRYNVRRRCPACGTRIDKH